MNATEYSRYNKRITRDGFTPEEAFYCPPGLPLWVYRLEREEGLPFCEIAKRELSAGVSIAQMALGIGVKKWTLEHWIRKMRKEGRICTLS